MNVKLGKIIIPVSILLLVLSFISPIATLVSSLLLLALIAFWLLKKSREQRVKAEACDLSFSGSSLDIVIVYPEMGSPFGKVLSALQSFFMKIIGRLGLSREAASSQHHKLKFPLHKCLLQVVVAFVIAILSLAAFLAWNNPLILTPLITIPIIPLIPKLSKSIRDAKRRQQVEDELPFFSLLASALSHAGLSLPRILGLAASSGIFPAMSSEGLLMKRESLFMGGDSISAMDSYAQRHPSRVLSSWILGYTSILRSGGDVVRYLEDKTRELFSVLKERWEGFVNQVNIMGEAMLALFLLAPLMMSMTALVFASEMNEGLFQVMTFGVIPLLSFSVLAALHIIRPSENTSYKPCWKAVAASSVCALSSATLSNLLGYNIINTILISITVAACPLTIDFELNKRSIEGLERDIVVFLRVIGEYKKIGLPLLVAIERSQREKYGKRFNNFIKSVLTRMKMGLTLYQSVLSLKVKSWLCKAIFFILDNLVASGGGSPATFEIMASFMDNYHRHKAKVKRSLTLYSLLGYATPIILTVCLSLISSFMVVDESMQFATAQQPMSNVITTNVQTLESALVHSKVMVLVSSIAIGLILGKAVDGSILSFRHLLICSIVALITLNLLI